jgi:DNA-binding transcriptional MerR regulator
METDTISIGRAALVLGVSTKTVQRWEQMGKLSLAGRTEGGHRRYLLADVERLATERSAA